MSSVICSARSYLGRSDNLIEFVRNVYSRNVGGENRENRRHEKIGRNAGTCSTDMIWFMSSVMDKA